jgi:putative membrane protein
MRLRTNFSDADLEKIRAATAAAEASNGAEIVPYIVGRVLETDAPRWRGSTIGALAGALVAGLMHFLGGFWGGSGVWWITLPTVVGAGLGWLAASAASVGRWLLPEDQIERAVQLRAEAAFLEEEVFNTRDRTGILVLLALFEHRAVILADEGIHRAVPQDEWQALVDALVQGIRSGRDVEALCEVIGRSGALLDRFEVERRPDDADELSNAPRLRDR